MNGYAGYPQPVPGGYRAMLRFCRDARPNPVMEKGEKPKVLDTEGEAWKEIALHLLAFMNGRDIRGEVFEGRQADNAADALFPGLEPTKRVATIRQRGSNRRTEVERIERREARG